MFAITRKPLISLNHLSIIFFLLFLAFLFPFQSVLSVEFPWQIDRNFISDDTHQMLKQRYPMISSEQQLIDLIETLMNIYPDLIIEPSFNEDHWVIKTKTHQYIQDISITTNQGIVPKQVISGLKHLIGSSYNYTISQKLISSTEKLLENQGYFNSSVTIEKTIRNKKGIRIQLLANLRSRCVIVKIKANFKLSENFSSKLIGASCVKSTIDNFIDELKTHYQKKSYIENTIAKYTIEQIPDSNQAIVIIGGSLGPLISYEFVTSKPPPLLNQDDSSPKNLHLRKIIAEVEKIIDKEIEPIITPEKYQPYVALAEIKTILEKHDFLNAQIFESTISNQTNNQPELNTKQIRFVIYPGDKIKLGSLRIIGASAIDKKTIYQTLSQFNFWFIK